MTNQHVVDMTEKLGALMWRLPDHPEARGDDPWGDEPDKIQWVDPTSDLDCLMVRGPSGAWCGYVGVPPGHRYHGKDYSDVLAYAHGGLTYADRCDENGHICHVPLNGRAEDVWWLGFDCAHGGDLMPRYVYMYPDEPNIWRHGEYRDVAYVSDQVTRLAAQLAQVPVEIEITTHD